MKNFKLVFPVLLGMVMMLPGYLHADEGMWLPMLIKRLNYADMQKNGLQLTADEIYSVNSSSLKDAIVVLNGGSCTAEIISSQGLMLTNHHCGYGTIQSHSSEEHDYLTDGFWAMSKDQEKQAEGMTAGFLIRMEDVTKAVLEGVTDGMSEDERDQAISTNMAAISDEAKKDTHYETYVRDFFDGNEFYLFVFEVYRDVRLVGAPPSSIGKFGGDTDNWMWPRHTGDFSLFRVYGGPDGKPADYSANNVPIKPKHHLPVSLDGVKENDYAMIMGFPGSTDRYLTSQGVKLAVEKEQPAIVKIREQRLNLMKEDMNADRAVGIKYAAKYSGVSNYYKYFQGQTRGLKRLRVYDKKKAEEDAFTAWANAQPTTKSRYGSVMKEFDEVYAQLDKYQLGRTYLNEAFFGSEIIVFSWRFQRLGRLLSAENADPLAVSAAINDLKETIADHFKNYNAPTDQKVTAALFSMFVNDIPVGMHPSLLDEANKKFKGDWNAYTANLFAKSIFSDRAKMDAFLADPKAKVLDKDPVYQLMSTGLQEYLANVRGPMADATNSMAHAQRLYAEGLRKMNPNKSYYPNANSTMRLTYGKVKDVYPADAVYYNYFTTLDGVMEKENPDVNDPNNEFIVPAKLRKLWEAKDFGQYGQDGKMMVNFISNNDITGGNSGSPVINGKGHLIGCAFDGNWEAMSGDIAFEPELQRTISVDARYILFIIDKYAGATHLINEMTLIKTEKPKEKAAAVPIDPANAPRSTVAPAK